MSPARHAAVAVTLLVLASCAENRNSETAATDTVAGDTTASARLDVVSVYQTLRADPRFSRFTALVDSIGLNQTLEGAGPFTVFAPTNEAFEEAGLPGESDLRGIVLNHVANGEIRSTDLSSGTTVGTLEGSMLPVGDSLRVGGATITAPDVEASNGVVHGIDRLLQLNSDGASM